MDVSSMTFCCGMTELGELSDVIDEAKEIGVSVVSYVRHRLAEEQITGGVVAVTTPASAAVARALKQLGFQRVGSSKSNHGDYKLTLWYKNITKAYKPVKKITKYDEQRHGSYYSSFYPSRW